MNSGTRRETYEQKKKPQKNDRAGDSPRTTVSTAVIRVTTMTPKLPAYVASGNESGSRELRWCTSKRDDEPRRRQKHRRTGSPSVRQWTGVMSTNLNV